MSLLRDRCQDEVAPELVFCEEGEKPALKRNTHDGLLKQGRPHFALNVCRILQRLHSSGEKESHDILIEQLDLRNVLQKCAGVKGYKSAMHGRTMVFDDGREYASYKAGYAGFREHIIDEERSVQRLGCFFVRLKKAKRGTIAERDSKSMDTFVTGEDTYSMWRIDTILRK